MRRPYENSVTSELARKGTRSHAGVLAQFAPEAH
jgi:hypothetical protein